MTITEMDGIGRMRIGETVEPSKGKLALQLPALIPGQYDNWMVMTDDSHWEPNVDYAALAAAGVGAFLTRSGGPTTWNEGSYNPRVDPHWFRKFKQAKATGRSVGGYWVHNPGQMLQNFRDPSDAIAQMKEAWYGEFIPDWLVLDVEINYFFRNGNRITVPAPNYVASVECVLEAMWKEWRKTVYLYTSVTHMNESSGGNFMHMLDRLNGTKLDDVRFPLQLAVYPAACQKSFELKNVSELKAITPPLANFKKYLSYGNTSTDSRIWQCSSAIKHQGAALDWNLVPMTRERWEDYIDFQGAVTPPPPPPDDEDQEDVIAKLYARLAADLAKLDGLKTQVDALQSQVDELSKWQRKVKEANQ
jgi:hypothetical protein